MRGFPPRQGLTSATAPDYGDRRARLHPSGQFTSPDAPSTRERRSAKECRMTFSTRRRTKVGIAVLATVGLTLAASPAIAAYSVDSTDLTDAVTADGLKVHLQALQDIADA